MANTCRYCGKKVDSEGQSCELCARLHRQSFIKHVGCITLVVTLVVVAVLSYVYTRPSEKLQNFEGELDARMEALSGRYVSDADYRYVMRLYRSNLSFKETGGWNGRLELSGPNPELDGRVLRCRAYKDVLAVELITEGDRTIVEMFTIDGDGNLRSRLPGHWPGIFSRHPLDGKREMF